MNNVKISGILHNDPMVKKTNRGRTVMVFPMIHNEKENLSSYIIVNAWDDLARTMEELQLGTGDSVLVTGKLRQDSWTHGGEVRTRLVVVAESINIDE